MLFNKMGYSYTFKICTEVKQLICSAGFSNVYNKIPQGKEFQDFVRRYPTWTLVYVTKLWELSTPLLKKLESETVRKHWDIVGDLLDRSSGIIEHDIKYAPFRYQKEYQCEIPTKTLLPIDKCINQYEKYVEWKLNK